MADPYATVINTGVTTADGVVKFFADRMLHGQLTAVDEASTVVSTIQEVAEDYVTKPFNPHELAARAARLIRRMGDYAYSMAPTLNIDERLAVDLVHQTAFVDGRPVALTRIETKLLHVLIRSARHPLTLENARAFPRLSP